MVKLVIIYDSETGNTERMAKCIEDGIKTVNGVALL
jgi:flavodoxin